MGDQVNEGDDETSKNTPQDIPNPLKNPGDADKFWHKKLNIIDSNDSQDEKSVEDNQTDDKDISQSQKDGDFEYSGDRNDSTQVLGEASEEEAVEMELPDEIKDEEMKEEEKQNTENEIDKSGPKKSG